MMVRLRRLVPLATVGTCALIAAAAFAHASTGGPLTGTWSGYIDGSGAKRQHIVIVVNAQQSGGSWRLSAKCHGPLTLDSISSGYHHFLRRRGTGVTCATGDIDCLKRVGPNVYDAVTSHRGGSYDVSGTLRRVRT